MTMHDKSGHDRYPGAHPMDYRAATPPPSPRLVPPTNGGWAATTILFFWPLAFVAFNRALSVPMLWAQGRDREAWEASESVARLGKIALGVGLALTVLFFVIYFAVIAVAVSSGVDTAPPYGSGGR